MLFAIGGGMDCTGDRAILKKILSAAQGAHSRVCVVTTASGDPQSQAQFYLDVFSSLGVKDCEVLPLTTRAEANDAQNAKIMQDADVIIFMGGDQLKLTRVFNRTYCGDVIRKKFQQGGIIAGTSAGAAALSKQMIYGSGIYKAGKRVGEKTTLHEGFGLSENLIIDMHFTEKGRLSRLFKMVAANPARTGLGVDEDTAAILKADGTMEVIGKGTVTIIDGVQAAAHVSGSLPATVLKAGDRYDLVKKAHIGRA